jgi:hypothetical protein
MRKMMLLGLALLAAVVGVSSVEAGAKFGHVAKKDYNWAQKDPKKAKTVLNTVWYAAIASGVGCVYLNFVRNKALVTRIAELEDKMSDIEQVSSSSKKNLWR